MFKKFLLYFPTPVFFLLGVYSTTHATGMCGDIWGIDSMTTMWFLMSLAHVGPYIKSN